MLILPAQRRQQASAESSISMFFFKAIFILALTALSSYALDSSPPETHDFSQPAFYVNLTMDEFLSLHDQYKQWHQKTAIKRDYVLNELDEVCLLIGPIYRFQNGWCSAPANHRKFYCHIPGNPSSCEERNRLSGTRACGKDTLCKTRQIQNAAGTSVQYPYCEAEVQVNKPTGSSSYQGEFDWDTVESSSWASIYATAVQGQHLGYQYTDGSYFNSGQGSSWSCIRCPWGSGAKLRMTHPNNPTEGYVSAFTLSEQRKTHTEASHSCSLALAVTYPETIGS
ncbi:hypothetical protein CMEL01_08476 [Colletotrichum melonis]|uniref:Secreted in xylem 1 n=1 Tax=Colletotrichum melonis TaxID=1209925 RepID=A0AAI9XIM8_9PEZI|nr:hypothetical protein CMEL01_08476 [Colletotrichum melonis]